MKYLLALVLALGLTGPVPAQEPRNPDIEAVISAQIDAFLKDDFVTAFTFASPMIREMFGTPERFGQMVRNGYPMVWRASRVEFLDLADFGGQPVQRVLLEDAGGAYFIAEYAMHATKDGWQISGVRILPADEISA